jgi:hypothetical protein
MKHPFKTLVAIVTAAISLTTPVTVSAAYTPPAVVTSNSYYEEVSNIATALSEAMPTEQQKEYLYEMCMASVFGANYQNWYNKYSPGDLCTTVSLNEYYKLPYTFRLAVLPITELKFSSEMKVCSYSRILLNSDGISQTNYENLKNMFQLCTNIKNATSNMNDTDKARYIHDIIIGLLTPASSKDNWQDYDDVFYAPACLNKGIAYCTAYANLYYIIGRMCGLNVGYDEHPSRDHVLNTITIDGVTTYVDVIWDDDVDQYKYFMTDHCRFSSDHHA